MNAIDNTLQIKRILKKCMRQETIVTMEFDSKNPGVNFKITDIDNTKIALVCLHSNLHKLWIDKVVTCYSKLTVPKGEIVYRFTTTVIDVVSQEQKLFLAMPKIIYFSRQ